MTVVVDARSNKSNQNAENRRKFLKRIKQSIKEAIPNFIHKNKKSVKDLSSQDQEIKISGRSLREPSFIYDRGDEEDYVLPGNETFVRGDKIKKSGEGDGKGRGGSDKDDGSQDDFIIRITADEFLDYFFDDLELPDLVKKNLIQSKATERRNSGWQIDGPPGRLSIVKSLKTAYLRRLGLVGPYRKELKKLEEDEDPTPDVLHRIDFLKHKIKSIPYIDSMDLRYRNFAKHPVPHTTATIFNVTDVSGSMGEREKTISRKFFYLLYLFLIKKYEVVNLVWIIHTAEAREVTEKEFFENTESGGTVISTALEVVENLIKTKYNPADSNLYVLQSTDGDNFTEDNANVKVILERLVPLVQFFGYIQIDSQYSTYTSFPNILEVYKSVAQTNKNLEIKTVKEESDIWPIFKELFSKE